MNVIGIALNELYRIFNILNNDKFDGCLPEPVITIQKGKSKSLGHFTLDKVWKNKKTIGENGEKNTEDVSEEDAAKYEINLNPEYFGNLTVPEIVGVLLHEMCHYRNKIEDIKDCNGNIHNKKFKTLADSVGLVVEKGKSVGWGYTSLSPELEEYINNIIQPNSVFEYFRTGIPKITKPRTKTLFKYTCPECGMNAKGKKDIQIKCGACDVLLEMEEVEEEETDN